MESMTVIFSFISESSFMIDVLGSKIAPVYVIVEIITFTEIDVKIVDNLWISRLGVGFKRDGNCG